MKKKSKEPSKNLNLEEQEFLTSFENDEWQTVDDLEERKKGVRKIASETLRKDVRVNIRLSSVDVSAIKEKAAYEGLPYQTLMASILHKYAAGHLRL